MDRWNLAVDLGGTRVRTGVVDHTLHVAGRTDEPTKHDLGPEGVIDQIVRQTRESVRQAGTDWSRISGLAIGAPGPLDSITGVVLSPPNMPGWDDVPLRTMLEAELQIPVKVVNDANAAALGESYFGAGRGHRNLVYLTISTGIGGGVVVEGKLMEGTSGTAGELGHMTIDRSGPMCKCGNRGCLEALASGTAIARRFREGLETGERSCASDWLGEALPSAEDVSRAAALGDPFALEVFTDAGEAVGFGVVNCIHIFNPDVIAIGGGVSKAGALLFDPIVQIVDQYALPVPRRAVRVVPAELGDDVGLVGAGAVAWTHDASGR